MGNRGAKFAGLEEAPQTLEQSVEGIAQEVCSPTPTRKNNLIVFTRSASQLAIEIMANSAVKMEKSFSGSVTDYDVTWTRSPRHTIPC